MDDKDLDGLEIEDILKNIKKKKINSKKKGNRTELELTKMLTNHFGKQFSRSVGSGNRWGQVANLPSHAKTTLTGDICPPEGFLWVIECKGGYEDKIDLNGTLEGCAQLDEFIQQSDDDADRSGRKPILIWKRSRKPWLALVRETDLSPQDFPNRMHYGDRVIVLLEKLLEAYKDDYWFDHSSGKSS
jgi:Holliday junction resolvase